MCKILRILKNLFRFNHLEDVAQKVNANKTWRFFASCAFVVKPAPIHHEDTKTQRIIMRFPSAEKSFPACEGFSA